MKESIKIVSPEKMEELKASLKEVLSPEVMEELAVSLKEIYGETAVERTKASVTRKGYDTTGYGYQFVVNRFNKVLPKYGLDWTTQDEIQLLNEYQTSTGKPYYEYAGKVSIMILDESRNVVSIRHCFGGHQSNSHADAMKGAFTNAFKKTAALFGVGADAYEGTVDEDYRPVEEPAALTAVSEEDMLKISACSSKAELSKLFDELGSKYKKSLLAPLIRDAVGKLEKK
jgi:hypothetical protein